MMKSWLAGIIRLCTCLLLCICLCLFTYTCLFQYQKVRWRMKKLLWWRAGWRESFVFVNVFVFVFFMYLSFFCIKRWDVEWRSCYDEGPAGGNHSSPRLPAHATLATYDCTASWTWWGTQQWEGNFCLKFFLANLKFYNRFSQQIGNLPINQLAFWNRCILVL